MFKKDLQSWFESHPAISVRQFGIECGYPGGGRFRIWIKQPAMDGELVSDTILKKILPILKNYGFHNYRFSIEELESKSKETLEISRSTIIKMKRAMKNYIDGKQPDFDIHIENAKRTAEIIDQFLNN